MWQPPLAFYVVAIAVHLTMYPGSRVFLITEPSSSLLNPCLGYLKDIFPMAETVMSTAMQDLYELVQARHMILSRSTFSWMATFFSKSLQSVVSPELVPARWSEAPYDLVEYSFPGYVALLDHHAGKGSWSVHPEVEVNGFEINLRDQMIAFPPHLLRCQKISHHVGGTARCPKDGEVQDIVERLGF
ncbi:hypothetical protein GUITHDRAFT_150569 [Guillardia theta CCMP2712]|uniref:Uncharacterized protein n=2 Tax=Guillardia theta TaxID=55529 RepID=L1JVZ8_GUITC|nr:hypothetical protein GUITHDRAFT_150569 [Guillardia theta CCMP2712]EKX52504.1 hypothetical protein GUITHDRAFT_150569 [Guillardia theta CCMP2712]|eukprot:XP_005839484.1 hypothetical protein GUITHDRAFT_150569 [Guillardia theta CCMP2712]